MISNIQLSLIVGGAGLVLGGLGYHLSKKTPSVFKDGSLNDKVLMGQGEYIVFRDDGQEVSRKTYERVYQVFNRYSPAGIVKNEKDPQKVAELCANRFNILQKEVIKIDPHLRISFVPRTLYELAFIQESIEEDVKAKEVCPHVNSYYRPSCSQWLEEKFSSKVCWHQCKFEDEGNNEDSRIKTMAYRLNQIMVKKWKATETGFKFSEIQEFTEKEITFLKDHFTTLNALRAQGLPCPLKNIDNRGPTMYFGYDYLDSMGMHWEGNPDIVKKAVEIECSPLARSSFLLFRGSSLKYNQPFYIDDPSMPFSLSYGAGLFSGVLFDGGATAFSLMRYLNGFIIPVKFEDLSNSAFHYPLVNTLCQLVGKGETFHGRTKGWKEAKIIAGIQMGAGAWDKKHLYSNLSREELIQNYFDHAARAIHLINR